MPAPAERLAKAEPANAPPDCPTVEELAKTYRPTTAIVGFAGKYVRLERLAKTGPVNVPPDRSIAEEPAKTFQPIMITAELAERFVRYGELANKVSALAIKATSLAGENVALAESRYAVRRSLPSPSIRSAIVARREKNAVPRVVAPRLKLLA